MFRDNLQNPQRTAMQSLRDLDDLTKLSMANQDYANMAFGGLVNNMMDPSDTMRYLESGGIVGLPVVQAGLGGFLKKITSAPRALAKGVAKGVKGVAKGVRNVAKSPIGRIALPLALAYFGPTLIPALGGLSAPALYGGSAGLSSLIAGDDPDEAIRRAALAAALTYVGGKVAGSGPGAAGQTAKDISVAQAGDVAKVAADPALLSYGDVGAQQVAQLGLQGAPVGSQFAGGLTGVNVAGTGVDPVAEVLKEGTATAQADKVLTEQQNIPQFTRAVQKSQEGARAALEPTFRQRLAESLPGSGVDKPGFLLGRELSKVPVLGNLVPESAVGQLAAGTAVLGGLSALGGEEQIPQDQLDMAGLTVETDFDKQRFVYRDAEGNRLTTAQALQMIQKASQGFGEGGQRMASGVRGAFERVDDNFQGASPEQLAQTVSQSIFSKSGGIVDPVLSASGGLIGMAYGGSMPMNNMDVKYKEFSGMVGGRGSGMEDNVYMPIVEGEQGQQVATLAVSPKEYVVDANTMSLLGNGNPDEGAEIMDKTVKDIRMAATGQTKQQKEIDGLAALNRMRRSV